MKPYMEEHEVNLLGEFKDGKLEREFMDLEYQSALRFKTHCPHPGNYEHPIFNSRLLLY